MSKKKEEAAKENKNHFMDNQYSFSELVDIEKLRAALEYYSGVTGYAIKLISLPSRESLISIGRHNICGEFHKVIPESARLCKESTSRFISRMTKTGNFKIHACCHGLIDGDVPIIIKGKQAASLLIGQVLLTAPDIDSIKIQAEQSGYNLTEYLDALKKVPVVREEQFKNSLFFLGQLVETIAETGQKNLELKNKSTKLLEEICRRENAELALNREKHFSEALINGLPGVFLMFDDNRKLVRWNKNYEMQTGFSKARLDQAPISHCFPVQERNKISQNVFQAFDIGTSEFETELLLKNGTGIPFYFTANKFSMNGNDYLLGIGNNISLRKNTEETLKAEYKFKDSLFNSSPACFAAIDKFGKVRTMNASMLEKLGYTIEEVIGKDYLTTFIPPEDQESVLKMVNTLKQADKNICIINRVTAKNGKMLLVEWHGRSIWNENGVLDYFFVVGIDITEKESLKEQLQQSQKIEAIGLLSAGVAHDFNNILTAISGYVDLSLLSIQKDNPGFNFLNEIKVVLDRAANLTKQLLTFSRKQVVQLKVVHLDEIIHDMNKMLYRLIDDDIRVNLELGAGSTPILADPGQIEQIIVNLVVNARDAIRMLNRSAKRKQIYIRTSETVISQRDDLGYNDLGAGKYKILEVNDTGCGISKEIREKIFEPFFTTKESGKGTGLGLATVYGIINQNKGSIYVYSDAGMGTVFKIYWPCFESAEREQSSKNEDMKKITSGSETIMVVEDDEVLKALTVKMLEQLGYKVILTIDSEDAINKISKNGRKVDLLFTDVIMPGMNGRQLADYVHNENPEIKVLFSSGYTDDLIADQGILDAGINFIAKPYTTQALSEKIRSILDSGEGNSLKNSENLRSNCNSVK